MTRARRASCVRLSATHVLLWTLSLAVAACGGKEALAPVGIDDGRPLPIRKKPAAQEPVTGYMVTALGERTLGPFFARRGSGYAASGLIAWMTVAEGTGRRVLVVPVGPSGVPRGGESVAAHVSVDTTMLVVRPLGGVMPGFLLTWSSLTDRGKSLWAVAVGDDGVPRSKPVELTRTNDDIVWIDVVPTDQGALCLWAEETRDNDANLIAAALGADGKVRGVPTRVARGIVGWHALEVPGGVGVSTVEAARADGRGKPTANRVLHHARPGGALSFHRLDPEGHATAPPIVVTTHPVIGGDVEVARDGSRLVFAWTDRRTADPSVTMAAIDAKGVVEPPRKVAEARGGASLLALTSGPAGVGVLFEAPARQRGETRHVHVARVAEGLTLERGGGLSLELSGRGQPELAATASGFAVLATTADCERGSPRCVNANAVATIHRTDGAVTLVQREALTFQTDPATLGWGMTCDGDVCFALAASPAPRGAPSRVRAVAIRPRTNIEPVAPKLAAPKDGPRVADITAIASGETVVDLATARFGGAHVVAMLSAKTGGGHRPPPGEAKATPVRLSTRIVRDDGAVGPPSVLSDRALHVGGVAIAGASSPEDGGAIAWVGRDGGDAEVHVTRIDKRGRRTNHVQLTTTKGDAADVTITWAGDGWIVAWVDWRDGNGEVYATKVSTDLQRVAREERVTKAPGDASDLVALASGDAVWLAWADSRESPRDGVADVFVSAVKKRDATRLVDDHRLLPTAAHSRTPHLTAGPDGLRIAWIEEAPLGAETPGASGFGAFWTTLDDAGKPVDKPTRIPVAGDGAATSVALETSAAGVRAVVARSTHDVISLDAVDLSASPPRPSSLLALDGPPSLDVALVLDGGVLYFNDEGPHLSDRRARRARISWAPEEPPPSEAQARPEGR